MELEGRGWAGLLEMLVKHETILQLWSVREQLVSQVMERWSIGNTQVIDMDIDTPLSAHKKLLTSWLINKTT
jgi:hypothetical protein